MRVPLAWPPERGGAGRRGGCGVRRDGRGRGGPERGSNSGVWACAHRRRLWKWRRTRRWGRREAAVGRITADLGSASRPPGSRVSRTIFSMWLHACPHRTAEDSSPPSTSCTESATTHPRAAVPPWNPPAPLAVRRHGMPRTALRPGGAGRSARPRQSPRLHRRLRVPAWRGARRASKAVAGGAHGVPQPGPTRGAGELCSIEERREDSGV